MLAAQTPPGTTESERLSHGADKETHQIHIHVGTDTIARIRQPGSPGQANLKELLDTHNNVPAHLRGYIHLEQEGLHLQVDSVHCGKKGTAAKDPYALHWYFMAYCKAHKCPTKAAKIKVGGPYENNGYLHL
ncbi:hypothetical protein BGZ75_004002 [Mortierella antarctica]|nr:hypothetical protein BGZ75_004002 [Mortierella antarctica]